MILSFLSRKSKSEEVINKIVLTHAYKTHKKILFSSINAARTVHTFFTVHNTNDSKFNSHVPYKICTNHVAFPVRVGISKFGFKIRFSNVRAARAPDYLNLEQIGSAHACRCRAIYIFAGLYTNQYYTTSR